MVANGILYPIGAAIAPDAPAPSGGSAASGASPAAAPVAEAKLPAAAARPDAGGRRHGPRPADHGQALAVEGAEGRGQAGAKLAKSLASEGVATATPRRRATLVMRNVAQSDDHARAQLGHPDHGQPGQAHRSAPISAQALRRGPGGPAHRRPSLLQVPLFQPGLVWSGPSGRSAGVALRGVREGCRPLGHAHRKPVTRRCARSLDRHLWTDRSSLTPKLITACTTWRVDAHCVRMSRR